jgi:hypothetical protein
MIQSDDRSLQALRDRAYVLAETGRYENAHAVEQALIGEGWPNAARALEDGYARSAVSEKCLAAKAH